MLSLQEKSLASRIADYEYCPEIYTYPTPRMYARLENFSPHGLELTSEINVYVHVPFCKQFCSFCGYFKTIYDEALQADFVEAVVQEIALRADDLRDKVIRTLHFGGGTPSLLTARQLEKLIRALQKVNPKILDSCLEVSIEATPESVDREKFLGYRQAGINRVSMGVQSLVDAEVALANRCLSPGLSSFELLRGAVECLRSVGIPDVVIDLMIGIEGQTIESFEHTVNKAITLRPETVQLYALGLMPRTGLARKKPMELMSGRLLYQGYEIGRSQFTQAGYRQDSHDRYTLRSSNGFVQGDDNIRGLSLLGLGAGARSYASRVHYRNTYASLNGRKALEQYMQNIGAGRHSVESGVFLDDDELMRQYAIGHIQALDEDHFQRRFGVRFQDRFHPLYEEMVQLDLVQHEGSVLRLTQRGLLFRDLLGRQLFSERARQLEEAYRF
jgi:oxygen-independent coproporphyrinogen-3 oxidase